MDMLNRISSIDYNKHLKINSKTSWQAVIDDKAIDTILALTHRHSYYTNLLCSRLWDFDQLPTDDDIIQEWGKYVDSEQGRITNEIARLSPNQRAVLLAIATSRVCQPASKNFLNRVHLSMASAAQAISTMLEKDHIYRDEDGYFYVLDPSIGYYLKFLYEH